MTLAPHWTSPDGAIVVYHSRWEAVRDAGLLPVREVALVHADPPYGIDYEPQRDCPGGFPGGKGRRHKFPKVTGDDQPFDPAPLVALDRPSVLWGGNHYADRLPTSPTWLFWDKREDFGDDNQSDGELAWTNLPGKALRRFSHLWRGALRRTEKEDRHLHPTQKPILLCSWVYGRAKLKRGDLVFVPYLGSGPDLPAAVAMGLRVIACDVEQWCCDTAISRLGAITPARAAEPVGPLFAQ